MSNQEKQIQEDVIAKVEDGQFIVNFNHGENNITVQEAIGFNNGVMKILGVGNVKEGEISINSEAISNLVDNMKGRFGELEKGFKFKSFEMKNGDSSISSILTVN